MPLYLSMSHPHGLIYEIMQTKKEFVTFFSQMNRVDALASLIRLTGRFAILCVFTYMFILRK